MNVNFNGYGENAATFIADSSITTAGVPVKITANGTVSACGAGDVFCGVCTALRDGYAVVQLSGYVTMSTASKIANGYAKLAAAANGTVAVNTAGREHLVLDSTSNTVGFIL